MYATRAAAQYAFQFSDADLTAINDAHNAAPVDRPISTSDLREYRSRQKAPASRESSEGTVT